MDKTNVATGDGGTKTAARIERAIVRVRGLNVMLDADLAALYGGNKDASQGRQEKLRSISG